MAKPVEYRRGVFLECFFGDHRLCGSFSGVSSPVQFRDHVFYFDLHSSLGLAYPLFLLEVSPRRKVHQSGRRGGGGAAKKKKKQQQKQQQLLLLRGGTGETIWPQH
jgi:hypothetical protein